MKKLMCTSLVIFGFFGLIGCGGLNFSQLSADAENFHPKTIAVLPATVGGFEPCRDVIDTVVSNCLVKTGGFENVVDTLSLKSRMTSSNELAIDVVTFIEKLNALGVCDATLGTRLSDSLQAEALFLTYVSAWGYGRIEGKKVARVGLGVKLVDASKGIVVWKANHEIKEDYWIIKPKLNELAVDLMELLLEEMPH